MEHLSAFDVRGSCLPVSVQNANSWHNWIHTFLSHYCASVPEPRTFLFYFDLWLTPLPVLFVMQRMWLQSQLTAHGGRVVGGEGGCNFVRKQAQPCRATCFCASFVMPCNLFLSYIVSDRNIFVMYQVAGLLFAAHALWYKLALSPAIGKCRSHRLLFAHTCISNFAKNRTFRVCSIGGVMLSS
jgi:hypothetical protein